MASLAKLREAVKLFPPKGDVSHHGSERHRFAQALAEAYQEKTGGTLRALQAEIGVWRKAQGFKTNWVLVPEKLMLIVSELSEAMEAFRHLTPGYLGRLAAGANAEPIDVAAEGFADQIEWHDNFNEELADTFIRLVDLTDALGIDLQHEVCQKMARNELRPFKHDKEC